MGIELLQNFLSLSSISAPYFFPKLNDLGQSELNNIFAFFDNLLICLSFIATKLLSPNFLVFLSYLCRNSFREKNIKFLLKQDAL